jgi:hypothetical protein
MGCQKIIRAFISRFKKAAPRPRDVQESSVCRKEFWTFKRAPRRSVLIVINGRHADSFRRMFIQNQEQFEYGGIVIPTWS